MEAAVSHLNKCERLFFRSRIVFIESLLKGVSRGNCSPQILYEALRINRKLVVLIRRTAGHTLVTEVYSALIHGTGRAGSRRLKRNVIAVGFSPVCPYKCAVRVLILCSRRDIQMIVSGRAAASINTTVHLGLICPINAIAVSITGESNRNRRNAQQGNQHYGKETSTLFHGYSSFHVHIGRQISNLAV